MKAEVHTGPMPREGRYASIVTLGPGATLELPGSKGKTLKIAARKLLP